MTKTHTTFLRTAVTAAALLALQPSPEAQAQISVYYGGKLVYAQKTGMPDSAQFVFDVHEPKASQERDASTVGGAIAKESDAVDLGLPSGTKWAPWNIGAKAPGEAGAYFAWGEVQAGKEKYDWSTYWWMAEGQSDLTYINKYQREDNAYKRHDVLWYDGTNEFLGDGKTTLEKTDDAATVNWGGKWRMPTQAEIKELSDKCTWEWKEEGAYATNSLAGCLVTGPNGNSIFLPAAGDRWGLNLSGLGSTGDYWSSEICTDWNESYWAPLLYLGADSHGANAINFRYVGVSVRTVISSAE